MRVTDEGFHRKVEALATSRRYYRFFWTPLLVLLFVSCSLLLVIGAMNDLSPLEVCVGVTTLAILSIAGTYYFGRPSKWSCPGCAMELFAQNSARGTSPFCHQCGTKRRYGSPNTALCEACDGAAQYHSQNYSLESVMTGVDLSKLAKVRRNLVSRPVYRSVKTIRHCQWCGVKLRESAL